jgi:transcription factor C subunit 7
MWLIPATETTLRKKQEGNRLVFNCVMGCADIAANATALKAYFPCVEDMYVPLTGVSHYGETIEELHVRSAIAMKRLLDDLRRNAPDVRTVLIMTHAATKIALGRALTKNIKLDVRTGTCSVDKYSAKQNGQLGQWEMEFTGKTDFLSKGEEMHWTFANINAPGSQEDIASRQIGKL